MIEPSGSSSISSVMRVWEIVFADKSFGEELKVRAKPRAPRKIAIGIAKESERRVRLFTISL